MNRPVLLLLGLAIATAPWVVVPAELPAAKPAVKPGESSATGTPAEAPRDPAQPEKPAQPAPRQTSWAEITPSQQPVPGPSSERDDADAARPELPPALYARRLAAASMPPAPPADPPRADLRSGHLDLPPPAA